MQTKVPRFIVKSVTRNIFLTTLLNISVIGKRNLQKKFATFVARHLAVQAWPIISSQCMGMLKGKNVTYVESV